MKIIAKLEAVELPELNNETKWILCKVLEHQTPKDAYPEILRWRLEGTRTCKDFDPLGPALAGDLDIELGPKVLCSSHQK